MIIRCSLCHTSYNFDEGLIEGEGVWVRCSRCEYIFFQENPGWAVTLPSLAKVGAAEIPAKPENDNTVWFWIVLAVLMVGIYLAVFPSTFHNIFSLVTSFFR